MKRFSLTLALVAAISQIAFAQNCMKIHGRAVDYRGDGFFAIWHIGTHHVFSPSDEQSVELVCRYFDCDSGDRQPALFADFTICPTEPFVSGAAQGATVKAIENPRVIPDWPVQKTPEEYTKDFYDWYVRRAQAEGSAWFKTLELARWDLSPRLSKLLQDDANAQAACSEIVGIDFDPFLFTQDPGDHYVAGKAKQIGKRYEVAIYRVSEGKQAEKPDLIAVIERNIDHWYFANFLYPAETTDLLSILKTSRPHCTLPRAHAQ